MGSTATGPSTRPARWRGPDRAGRGCLKIVNYRHAFHAGNFADVMKHVILTRILVHLKVKPAPFRAIDTHAGTGLYDLQADAAERTQEWRGGVDRLGEPFAPEVEALIAPYRAILATVRERHGDAYPGSPLIMRELMRPQDRAVFVELHPEDEAVLARRFRRDTQVKVLHLDGWTALHALISGKGAARARPRRSALRGARRARAPRPRDGKGA